MDPAMPGRRDAGGLGIAVIDHPAPLEAERGVDLAALGAEIAIALLVFADQFAEPPGPQLRPEGLATPPREDFEKKQFHGARPVREAREGSDAIGGPNCPVLSGHKPVRSRTGADQNARNRPNPFIPRT